MLSGSIVEAMHAQVGGTMTLTARLTTAMVALVLVTAGALSVLSTFMAGVIAVLGAILLAAMLARSLALPSNR
jgi:membrane-bound ClpP family serine protease